MKKTAIALAMISAAILCLSECSYNSRNSDSRSELSEGNIQSSSEGDSHPDKDQAESVGDSETDCITVFVDEVKMRIILEKMQFIEHGAVKSNRIIEINDYTIEPMAIYFDDPCIIGIDIYSGIKVKFQQK